MPASVADLDGVVFSCLGYCDILLLRLLSNVGLSKDLADASEKTHTLN